MLHDAEFAGIDHEAPFVCVAHKLKPRKCVAFQGTDTGRKFYMCAIENVSAELPFFFNRSL